MKIIPDVASTMPRKDWQWDSTTKGVHTYESKLVWYCRSTSGHPSSDGASDQSYEDYLLNGPQQQDVPPEIEKELRSLVAERWTEPRVSSVFECWDHRDNVEVSFYPAAKPDQAAPEGIFLARVTRGRFPNPPDGPIEWFRHSATLYRGTFWVVRIIQSREELSPQGIIEGSRTEGRRVFVSEDQGATWQPGPEEVDVSGLEEVCVSAW